MLPGSRATLSPVVLAKLLDGDGDGDVGEGLIRGVGFGGETSVFAQTSRLEKTSIVPIIKHRLTITTQIFHFKNLLMNLALRSRGVSFQYPGRQVGVIIRARASKLESEQTRL